MTAAAVTRTSSECPRPQPSSSPPDSAGPTSSIDGRPPPQAPDQPACRASSNVHELGEVGQQRGKRPQTRLLVRFQTPLQQEAEPAQLWRVALQTAACRRNGTLLDGRRRGPRKEGTAPPGLQPLCPRRCHHCRRRCRTPLRLHRQRRPADPHWAAAVGCRRHWTQRERRAQRAARVWPSWRRAAGDATSDSRRRDCRCEWLLL